MFEATSGLGTGGNSVAVPLQSFVSIFKAALHDQHRQLQNINDTNVRFKLVLDGSSDHSFSRMLRYIDAIRQQTSGGSGISSVSQDGLSQDDFFHAKLMESADQLLFHGSAFDDDERHQLQLMNAIQTPLQQGDCLLLVEVESIHDCLYDLFNQYLFSVGKADLFYAYLALKAVNKPINVHKDTQIVLVIHSSQLRITPAPLLNRFEKFDIDTEQLWTIYKEAWKRQRRMQVELHRLSPSTVPALTAAQADALAQELDAVQGEGGGVRASAAERPGGLLSRRDHPVPAVGCARHGAGDGCGQQSRVILQPAA